MLFSNAMSIRTHPVSSPALVVVALAFSLVVVGIAGCKRSEPPPDLLKSQRDAMERAKGVGKTMQRAVDQEGRKADEDGK